MPHLCARSETFDRPRDMKASTSGRSAESIGSVLTRWTRNTVGAVLKVRPLPQHIGLIMDGNRRFAEQRRAECIEGHKYGYSKVSLIQPWNMAHDRD